MAESRRYEVSPAVVDLVGGLFGGAAATLSTHPLDLAKTRMQTHLGSVAKGQGQASAPTTYSILSGLVRSDRPLRNLYRGLNGTLLANGLSQGSFFFFKTQYEGLVFDWKRGDTTTTTGVRMSAADYFLASTLAGITVQVLTNPLWVLRTRMVTRDATNAGAYPNLWRGARDILAREGVRGFYRGLGMGFLTVSHSGILFAVYEPGKRMLVERRQAASVRTGAEAGAAQLTNAETTVLSTVSKLVAGAVSFPLVTLRNRLQNNDARQLYGRGVVDVVVNLWRERGLRGFYAGLVPATLRVLPANVVVLLVLENVRNYMPRWVSVSQS